MEKQEIKVTELKEDAAIIEEKMTYEKNLEQLKNEVQDLEYRKQNVYSQIVQMSDIYKGYVKKQEALKKIIAQLEPTEEKPKTVEDIVNSL